MAEWPERLRIRLQWAVVRSQRFPGLKTLLGWVCRAGTWNVGRLLVKLPGVEAVYIRHTHPRSPSFVPGHSDLDLTVVLSDRSARDLGNLEAVADRLEKRSLFHYYVSPEDARIITPGEMARLAGGWPPAEVLTGPADWTLLAGRDIRPPDSSSLHADELPWHPEFNRWWGHILQDYLLNTMPGLENRYHRVFYRGAVKQVAYFLAARELSPPRTGSSPDHELVQWVFGRDPGMKELLSGLGERDFWEGKEKDLRERIFREVLQRAGDFFGDFHSEPGIKEKKVFPAVEDHLHQGAYDALASKLESLSGLKPHIAGVRAYPTPYCHPYFYQAELILPESISAEELTGLAGLIRRTFRGREFAAGGHRFSLTMVPEKASLTTLAYRGTPFPFLAEHVGRYGRMLGRSQPLTMKVTAREEDLVPWCRSFYPCLALNLGRRIEHSSRTLNFCQLAGVRLFLETGDVVTDALSLKVRHREAFGEDSPPDILWEYLLRDKPGRGEGDLYRAAASRLAAEMDAVERSLQRFEDQSPSWAGKESRR